MNESLTPAVFQILLALSDQNRHGYGIIKDVLERTNGSMRLGAGTLYGTINRMLEAKLIAEALTPSDNDDERRKYYQLTIHGRSTAQLEARRLEKLVLDSRKRKLLPKGVE